MDDVTLLVQARGGDQAAFAQLVERHRTHVWAVCLSTTGNRHDAEDALQNTLIAAWQHLDRFRGEARFGTWLHRIAVNNALMVVRSRKPDTDLTDFTDADVSVTLTDDGPGFDESIATRDELRSALARLPEDFRTALILREFGDLTYADIAEHQGVGVQTVKSRLNRARRQLAQILGESTRGS
ncbi:RNA polymerase sigma factor [Rhodococcus sp. NPDC058505]|uniref:RNA polymerase sigma factor n=1 Tax=unclassified Rhodococcus (in: high G+C Gram-positive bacteria) TaxID=192944 RepID=UPI00365B1B0E